MRDTKKITTGIDVKQNKSTSLYHAIQGFMDMKQGESYLNEAFKSRFDNIHETTELDRRDNILRR